MVAQSTNRIADALETEQELISTAKAAISDCNFTVGECAAKWCRKYARGRTDAYFGHLVGLSGDQIYMRRRVWEEFGDDCSGSCFRDYTALKWSHFYVALTWSDALECLAWANKNEATIAEMKAWRRMQSGEDLTVESEAVVADDEVGTGDSISGDPVPEYSGTSDSIDHAEAISPISAPDHDPAESAYAPFRKSGGPPRDETHEAPDRSTRNGKSDLASMRGAWRALRQLCEQVGPNAAIAVCQETISDIELTDSIETEDDARLLSLINAIKEQA